ncbi:hypothetical protein EXIGLDRAFT_667938 [Exidia glandulosa HHB12029]|uniref:Uncharacterized protein n=1 Tax=Exidia glandulosa HHB12029 TaxID=1314781 RepID=A0A165MWZ4_EXIGL|nr:hypothetical protein EXIGLDRAFT_667938 [Exidia glandulosa HHB12029]
MRTLVFALGFERRRYTTAAPSPYFFCLGLRFHTKRYHGSARNPYTVNGGIILAIPCPGFAVVAGDTRAPLSERATCPSGLCVEAEAIFNFKIDNALLFFANPAATGDMFAKTVEERLETESRSSTRARNIHLLSTARSIQTTLHAKCSFPLYMWAVFGGLDNTGAYSFLGSCEREPYHASGAAQSSV